MCGTSTPARRATVSVQSSRQRLGEALVTLGDSHGRERVRLYVDRHDEPRLEFLDERGVAQFPTESRKVRLPPGDIPSFRGETALQLLALAGHDVDALIGLVEMEGADRTPSGGAQA